MKVLFISHTYVTSINQQKLEALSRIKEIDLGLIVPPIWRAPLRLTPLEKSFAESYQIFPIPVFFNGNNDRYFYHPLKLFLTFLKFRPRIVHIEEEPWSFSAFQASKLAKLFGAKVIIFTWENIKRKHKWFYKIIEKINLRLADTVICGNSEAEKIIKTKTAKPTFVLPQLGIDQNYFQKKKLEIGNWKLEIPTIGFIGRLDYQKGIMTLLEAVTLLDFEFRLLLIGSGPLKDQILDFARKNNLEDKIEIREGVKHDQIPEILSEIDILVLPSITTPVWKEQFGHVLIEAMAGGVPVIGSSSGAIPEVIGDAGLIFQEGNSQDLYEKIKKIYPALFPKKISLENEKLKKGGVKNDQDLYQNLIKKGLDRVKNNFSHQKIAEKIYQIYQKLFGL